MGAQRTSFDKLQRDRAKKAKAAAKRDRRLTGTDVPALTIDLEAEEGAEPVLAPDEPVSAADMLKVIESIHRRFEAGTMTLEDFEEQKADLMARLPID